MKGPERRAPRHPRLFLFAGVALVLTLLAASATAIGESLTVVDDVAETVRRLRTRHFGRTVLVVGHSDTVPEIVTALTGRPFPTPGRVAYDGMWVVTLARDGHASLLTLRYGTPVDDGTRPRPSRAR